jgi:hypothetical protein
MILRPHCSLISRLATGACVALGLAACGGDGGTDPARAPTSFSRIQSQVFRTACVSCHTKGAPDATFSGLVLDDDVAYANLVGVQSTHVNARADGLLRVAPGDPDKSLLLHKLHLDGGHHARDYGSPMPIGGQPLSVGQLKFVEEWIAAGAPKDGDAIDPTLLADRTVQMLEQFTALAPPAQGYQLTTASFPVAPSFERELFLRRNLGNAAPVYLNRIETKMRLGSHHLIAYTFDPSIPAIAVPQPDVIRDLRDANGLLVLGTLLTMPYHVFFAGAMSPATDYRFPDGVAMRVPANATFDLNSHYVNKTGIPFTGEAYVNLHSVDAAQVQHVAATLNWGNLSFTLPSKQRTTIAKTFLVSEPTTIFALASHMHKRGEKFVIKIKGGPRDGEIVYTNTDWAHPVFTNYDTPIVLQAGQGLTSEITYYNETNQAIGFGLTSEDEMGIIFGYYYRS